MPDYYWYLKGLCHLLPQYAGVVFSRNKVKLPEIKFYSDRQTVDLIVNSGMSLTRFGDGEFAWMNGKRLESYQTLSDNFVRDLRAAFMSKDSNVIIGIPYGIFDSSHCNLRARLWWRIIRETTGRDTFPLLAVGKIYAKSNITRPYIDYRDRKFSADAFANLRRIWDGRDVCFVEGEQTRLGMGNNLFDNAKSIRRILCPAKDAYERLDEIQEAVCRNVSKDVLILAALGPTASILAVRLARLGYQAVDIGHVDVEYIWFKNHSVLRDSIPGKYVNESGEKFTEDIYANDPVYRESIICEVL